METLVKFAKQRKGVVVALVVVVIDEGPDLALCHSRIPSKVWDTP